MDNIPEGASYEEIVTLPYDDPVPHEAHALQQQPTHEAAQAQLGLLDRIGTNKVYLIADSAQPRKQPDAAIPAVLKRKRFQEDEDVDMDEDSQDLRGNALFFIGAPISHLPTARIFAYATHFGAQPLALEWINDKSCIIVFESKSQARAAHLQLRKSLAEDTDMDGFVTAKPIPVALWPPGERINSSLGKGEGLRGVIQMRWARCSDVKRKGAKKESQFYKKYGECAGKDGDGVLKRRREDAEVDESSLDADLDAYLATDKRSSHSPPPSKMRSDLMTEGDRLSMKRTHTTRQPRLDGSLADRLHTNRRAVEERREPRGNGRRNNRPHKTRQDLDDELDAFLNQRE